MPRPPCSVLYYCLAKTMLKTNSGPTHRSLLKSLTQNLSRSLRKLKTFNLWLKSNIFGNQLEHPLSLPHESDNFCSFRMNPIALNTGGPASLQIDSHHRGTERTEKNVFIRLVDAGQIKGYPRRADSYDPIVVSRLDHNENCLRDLRASVVNLVLVFCLP